MSELALQHAAHRARMSRMNGAAVRPVEIDDQNERIISELKQHIAGLNARLERQDGQIVAQRAYIEKLAGVAADFNPKLEEIFTSCCKFYEVSPADMRGPARSSGLPFRRQIYYFLGREYGHSLHQIGRFIHKDHTCVVHGTKRIRTLLETDETLRDDIDVLRKKIAARAFERRQALEEVLKAGAEVAA